MIIDMTGEECLREKRDRCSEGHENDKKERTKMDDIVVEHIPESLRHLRVHGCLEEGLKSHVCTKYLAVKSIKIKAAVKL